ncbi:hypothetical protein BLS_005806 [Venturia inaequalis]|uniref:Uncharacterized protein n=1 Tax=Venturia inaequalis TaxID=5025 RepID=A0A8H3UF71_VENIN|nr:hypothetical protein BLS_005806 [Venturia inaequalis]
MERSINTKARQGSASSLASDPDHGKSSEVRRTLVTSIFAWWTEIVFLSAAMMAFFAISMTLYKSHGKEQAEIKYSISLNTLIAILSTLLRTVISQIKWMAYTQPQSMSNLARFDGASRGPWGSLLLLFNMNQISLAAIGCVVMIFSLAIGPFTQQAIKTTVCEKHMISADSSIPVARIVHDVPPGVQNWTSSSNASYISQLPRQYGVPGTEIDFETKAAVLSGLTVRPVDNSSAFAVHCSTGNCTFPVSGGITHSSSGVCSRCVDISYMISSAPFDSTYTRVHPLNLPDGLTIDHMGYNATLMMSVLADYSLDWARPAAEPFFSSLLSISTLNFTVLAYTGNNCSLSFGGKNCSKAAVNLWPRDYAVGVSCILFPCVKNYFGEVRNGVFKENIVSELPSLTGPPIGKAPWGFGGAFIDHPQFNTPCMIDGQSFTANNISTVWNTARTRHSFIETQIEGESIMMPSECIYGISANYLTALRSFLRSVFHGSCAYGAATQVPTFVTCDQWWLGSLYNRGNATLLSINETMNNVANSITNAMRAGGMNMDATQANVTGTAVQTTVCTRFDWPWLAFPTMLLIITLLLLLVMATKTLLDDAQIPIWKSSILPLLFVGNGIGAINSSEDLDDVHKEANMTTMSLKFDGHGWAFVGESHGGRLDTVDRQTNEE